MPKSWLEGFAYLGMLSLSIAGQKMPLSAHLDGQNMALETLTADADRQFDEPFVEIIFNSAQGFGASARLEGEVQNGAETASKPEIYSHWAL